MLSTAMPHQTAAAHPVKALLTGVGMTLPIVTKYAPGYSAPGSIGGNSISTNTTGSTTPVGGTTPAQMRGAYGISNISFGGVAGDGTGETIAILDPGDDPAMVNSTAGNFSTSDLAIFDAQYGLPNPPSFIKDGFTDPASGTPALTSTLPGANAINTADGEISLDVEWAHSMAPNANILLVEGNPNFSDIYNGVLAVDAAAASMHIVVLSMSFGGNENGTLSSTANAEGVDGFYFDTAGLVYAASTGDSGAYGRGTSTINSQFPASSSNVLAVGGTTLTVSGNNYVSETTWANGTSSGTSGGGGGGFSVFEPQPAYQTGKVNGISTTVRTYPDISLDANPNTGVPIYDSPDYGVGTGWIPGFEGGTSLSSPLMAGVIAIADQGRALNGFPLLNSSGGSGVSASNPNGNSSGSDIHTLLYGDSSADFHDITGGFSIATATYAPKIGYDLSTGIGSPVGNKLMPDLAYPGSIAPSVGTQPLNQSVGAGTMVSFTAAASGTPTPTVQWQFSSNSGSSYSTIAGATSTTYSFTANISQNGYLYEAVFTNIQGSTTSNPATLGVTATAPTLSASQIGDGTVQRSSVKSIAVTFSEAVNFSSTSFTLLQYAQNANGTINTGVAATDVSAGVTATSADGITWTISVIAGGSLDRTAASTAAGFLNNGIFQLVLHGAHITGAGMTVFNSGADQIVGFNSIEAGGTSNYFHVLYGDLNGDGKVNATDYFQFSRDYLANIGAANYNAAFDYNGDGKINATDYFQFSRNYLISYSY